MTNMTGFTDMLFNSMNNPECSFWVGATIGQYMVLKIAFGFVIAYVVCKLFDKWFLEPVSEIIKKKLWKRS